MFPPTGLTAGIDQPLAVPYEAFLNLSRRVYIQLDVDAGLCAKDRGLDQNPICVLQCLGENAEDPGEMLDVCMLHHSKGLMKDRIVEFVSVSIHLSRANAHPDFSRISQDRSRYGLDIGSRGSGPTLQDYVGRHSERCQ
jgi:hypothetical protein